MNVMVGSEGPCTIKQAAEGSWGEGACYLLGIRVVLGEPGSIENFPGCEIVGTRAFDFNSQKSPPVLWFSFLRAYLLCNSMPRCLAAPSNLAAASSSVNILRNCRKLEPTFVHLYAVKAFGAQPLRALSIFQSHFLICNLFSTGYPSKCNKSVE